MRRRPHAAGNQEPNMFKPAIIFALVASLVSLVACGGDKTDTAGDTAAAE
jgi:hypothetical protein